MERPRCVCCDNLPPLPEPHGFCARCAELARTLFDLAEGEFEFVATQERALVVH